MAARSNQFSVNSKIIIVGGGVIGLSIARALALRGACDVTVIEKGEFGREASWAAGGILAPQVEADAADDFLRLACASRDMYQAFAKALLDETGIDIELDLTGTIYVGFTAEEEAEFRNRLEWQSKQGLAVEWLTGEQARAIEPALSGHVRCALRFPNDAQVENRRLVEALLIANRKLGVSLIGHCPVDQIRVAHRQVEGVETSQGFVNCPVAVIAAGAWSSTIDPAGMVAVEPVRGQMLCFETKPRIARHVIYSSRGYLIPRRDGRLIAGSTSERGGFDKSVTIEGIRSIKMMAAEIVPALNDMPMIDAWAGLRPRNRNDALLIGISPDVRGLIYATGHYRNGILLAPITGELIADMM